MCCDIETNRARYATLKFEGVVSNLEVAGQLNALVPLVYLSAPCKSVAFRSISVASSLYWKLVASVQSIYVAIEVSKKTALVTGTEHTPPDVQAR